MQGCSFYVHYMCILGFCRAKTKCQFSFACVESLVFTIYGKNQGCGGEACNIWFCLHIMMFMSINLWETIESFKEIKGEKVVECFYTYKPNDAWTKMFWAYFCQLGMYLHHSQVFVFIFNTRYNTSCISLGYLFQLQPNPYMHYGSPCKIMNNWPLPNCHIQIKTHANIKSYHGALKCWFSFDTKGLKRCHIN